MTFAGVAQAAGISRSRLYTRPDISSQIRTLRQKADGTGSAGAIPAAPRPTDASLRAGLTTAFKQIDVTAQLIADKDPVLAAVPAGRPVLGLAVTLEPFHVANAAFDPFPVTRTPVTVADAAEIENLATVTGISAGQLLLDRAADEVRSTWSLDTAFEGRTRGRTQPGPRPHPAEIGHLG